jgi:hypothetical protein
VKGYGASAGRKVSMADFCRQCSFDIFGFDAEDLKFSKPLEEGHYWSALCEGCGFIGVNAAGECCTPDCLQKHGTEDGKPKPYPTKNKRGEGQ